MIALGVVVEVLKKLFCVFPLFFRHSWGQLTITSDHCVCNMCLCLCNLPACAICNLDLCVTQLAGLLTFLRETDWWGTKGKRAYSRGVRWSTGAWVSFFAQSYTSGQCKQGLALASKSERQARQAGQNSGHPGSAHSLLSTRSTDLSFLALLCIRMIYSTLLSQRSLTCGTQIYFSYTSKTDN